TIVCCQQMAERNEEHMKTNHSRIMLGCALACLLLLLALSFTVLPVAAAPQAGAPDIASIDAYISAQMQTNHIPGVALGLVHNDQIVHLGGFVEADQSGRAVRSHTPLSLASVTKTSMAVPVFPMAAYAKISV